MGDCLKRYNINADINNVGQMKVPITPTHNKSTWRFFTQASSIIMLDKKANSSVLKGVYSIYFKVWKFTNKIEKAIISVDIFQCK